MTQPNLYLKNPSLTLYAFHLRSDAVAEVVADATHLWEKLTQLSDYFSAPELRELPTQLICYQNGHYYPDGELGQQTHYLELIPQREWHFSSVLQNDLRRCGSVYPLRLHDTYAVDFTIYYPNQVVDIEQLHQLNPQDCLIPSFIQASLGQTLLFYAEPLSKTLDEQALANHCVKALFTQAKSVSPSRRGQLFGNAIFEYEIISLPEAMHPNELIHLLVWLGDHKQTLELATEANIWLINLLNCHHKICFAYSQAQQSHRSAGQIYRQLESYNQRLDQLPTAPAKRLESLETILNQTSANTFKYAYHFRDLTDQHTTIVTNTINYVKWLAHLRDLSLPTDDLTWLADFGEKTSQLYQQQITVYLDYLKPGHHLFEQQTTTILGLVHLGEQKQQMIRAEKFEFLITFIGAAVGTGAISATVIPDPPHLIDLVAKLFEIIQLSYLIESVVKLSQIMQLPYLIDLVVKLFEFVRLPIFEMPAWFNNFPVVPESLFKVMFHLIVGGIAAMFFTPLISSLSKRFTIKQ